MRKVLFVFGVILFLVPQTLVLAKDAKGSASEQEFCRLDKDNNREISYEEFQNCEFYKLEHVKALPIGKQELSAKTGEAPTEDELKTSLFKQADKNKDNKIDRKEWEEFYNLVMDPGSGSIPRHHEHGRP